jgi:hypothetical protein
VSTVSSLGPGLFLLFIKDTTTNIKPNLSLFADDCNVYSEDFSSSDHPILQQDLNYFLTLNLNSNMLTAYGTYIPKMRKQDQNVQRRGARFVPNDYSPYSSVTTML